jgi:hypothetical protein
MTQANWLVDKIDNANYLAPQGFKLSVLKFPKVSFLCQSVDIPGIRITDITVPNPFRDYSIAGTETEFEDLTVKFLIDEDMSNYATIHKWLKKTGLAEQYDTDKDPIEGQIVLEILNSNWQSNLVIEYDDAWPVSLSPVVFDSTETGVQYVTATVTFKYLIYRIKYDGTVIS